MPLNSPGGSACSGARGELCCVRHCCSDLFQLQDSGGDQNADGEKWTLITVDDTPRTPILHYQLENLTPNTRYKLIARAENGLGWSDYSSEFIFRTAPGLSRSLVP